MNKRPNVKCKGMKLLEGNRRKSLRPWVRQRVLRYDTKKHDSEKEKKNFGEFPCGAVG